MIFARQSYARFVVVSCSLFVVAEARSSRADEPAVIPPTPIERVDALHPAGVSMTTTTDVTLAVEVGIDGHIGPMEIISSGGAAFDATAMAAAAKWRFTPAMRAGAAVPSRIRLSFHFEAQPAAASPAAALPSIPAPTGSTGSAPPPSGEVTSSEAPEKPPAPSEPALEPVEVTVTGRRPPPSRGAADIPITFGALAKVPQQNASGFLKLAPGILLSNEGGEAHAEQVFLRGFDAREGQDIEFSVDGMPINEAGNLHGNGYADTHFIIPELIESLRVLEGPFDPRQGNFAVAGSADYHLGLTERGMTAKFSAGNYGTYRTLLLYGPPNSSEGTFAGGELYQTDGYGQNRDGRRGSVMAQYEGGSGATHYRLFGQAYASSFHTAGVLRDDDYRSGRKGFYDTYDPLQGEDASRYSATAAITHRNGPLVVENMLYAIARPLRLRENFTGFLNDVQGQLQAPHGQRGDLIDLNVMESTVGLRGSARLSKEVLHQQQEIEIGYFARGDFGSGVQQRIEAATGHPYQTDTNLDYRLADIGLYADLNLRPLRWLALRGGARSDLFSFDVHNNCAVPLAGGAVNLPTSTRPLYDASCLDQEAMGAHREPDQRASTQSAAILPRASILVGPWWGATASASFGQGVRSIDPIYITQDAKTPFASITSADGGLLWARHFSAANDFTLRSSFFYTKVDHDLIFSQTAGRNTLAGPTTRIGSASAVRLTGSFYDIAANFTYVRATFDDTALLVPYVPDLVVRADSALFGALPWRWAVWHGTPVRASLAAGLSYVGPRALPYGARSDTIFTVDANATLSWSIFEAGVSAQNLFDTRYRLGEYNYASDFHSEPFATQVPVRHFSAGAPLTVLASFAIHLGGAR